MKRNFFTIKTKIMLLVLVWIVMPLGVYSTYIVNSQSKIYLQREDSFHNTVNSLILDSVNANFYGYVNQQLSSVVALRRQLFTVSTILKNAKIDSQTSSERLNRLIQKAQLLSWNKVGISGFIYNTKNPNQSLMLTDENKKLLNYYDIRGESLEKIIHNKVLSSGNFYYVYKEDKDDAYLCLLQPTLKNPDEIIVTTCQINDLKERYESSYDDVLNGVSMLFDAINTEIFNDILILDNKAKILLSQKNNQSLSGKIPQNILNEAKKLSSTSFFIKDNNINLRIRLSYFKPLNWYIASVSNLDKTYAPLYEMITRLIFIAIAIILFSLILALAITTKALNPLKIIANKANLFSNANLDDPDAITKVAQSLPECKGDEIGQLSLALRTMAHSLSDKIQNLVKSTSIQKRLEGELDAASLIQKGMLPQDLDNLPCAPYAISSLLIPAKEVGGDLYDVIYLEDNKVALIIGDVSDKGVPASLFMTMTVTLVRQAIALKMSPGQILTETNKALSAHNPNMMFVTLFVAIFDLSTEEITYANGGHCLPILINNKKEIRYLKNSSGPVVGALEDLIYEEFTDRILKDETLLLYTDGVTEAQNEQLNLFGDERLEEFLKNNSLDTPKSILDDLHKTLVTYRDKAPQSDDITALCIKRL